MSWDVLLLPVPARFGSLAGLPDGWSPGPVGGRDRVLAAVRQAAPETDLSGPSWGLLTGPAWSVELNIGEQDPVESVMLHVRGGGDGVLPVIHRLAAALGRRAIDCSGGEFLTEGDTGNRHAFQEFRDRVLADPPGTAPHGNGPGGRGLRGPGGGPGRHGLGGAAPARSRHAG
ncbi:hypothetical protein V1L54_20815 [Streptomyces sp. TRM 70361]|uniref:hypothetical protein n=1 Tax=Streptomyces sp. TRM 70361 TaxID=3116553 RepID=UPI002E7B1084|nr:hypothetical protein [Streptomyces sp. TRM 70361]MEE1941815.1 hypothetical protein [Streptomyces sp. TRM 70361]